MLELRKSLYGLEKAVRRWRQLLHSKPAAATFTWCESDMCFYWKRDGGFIVVGVYVDDIFPTGTSSGHARNSQRSARVHAGPGGGYLAPLRDNGIFDANLTWTPIDDSCYELEEGDAELLGTSSARP